MCPCAHVCAAWRDTNTAEVTFANSYGDKNNDTAAVVLGAKAVTRAGWGAEKIL